MKIKCVNGPNDDKKVDSSLGERWPDIMYYEYQNPNIVVGFYVLNGSRYIWEGKLEEWYVKGLGNKK